jgi:hypothetical protein
MDEAQEISELQKLSPGVALSLYRKIDNLEKNHVIALQEIKSTVINEVSDLFETKISLLHQELINPIADLERRIVIQEDKEQVAHERLTYIETNTKGLDKLRDAIECMEVEKKGEAINDHHKITTRERAMLLATSLGSIAAIGAVVVAIIIR